MLNKICILCNSKKLFLTFYYIFIDTQWTTSRDNMNIRTYNRYIILDFPSHNFFKKSYAFPLR